MNDTIVFASTSPRCEREQLQERYTLADLSRLLDGDDPIEAYCEFCDKFWAVNLQKRVELREFVAAACEGTSPSTHTYENDQSEL
jgi:hypothetical protein